MLQVKVIGIGAAGNKAAIKLIEDKVVQKEDVILMNSTMRDIPQEYKDMAIMIEGSFQGYAKERGLANQYVTENLRQNKISLDTILRPEDKFVIIVTSVEGGTGSGASTVLAQYFSEVLNATVHLFAFGGFEDDMTGFKNTVEWFNELSPKYVVEAISNKKFLKEAYNNRIKAQELANQEFSNRVKVLIGNTIRESPDQNIDITDFMKLDLTSGFMTIESHTLDGIKNVDDFNQALIDAIDHSKSFDIEPTPSDKTRGRIGVILEVNERTKSFVDWSFQVLRDRYANPLDLFIHVQDNIHKEESISFIIAGMRIPSDKIERLYEEYVERISKAEDDDDFFKKKFDTSSANVFNMDMSRNDPNALKSKRDAFFGSIGGNRPVIDQAHLQQPSTPTPVKQQPQQTKPKHEIVSPIKDRAGNAVNLNVGFNQTDY